MFAVVTRKRESGPALHLPCQSDWQGEECWDRSPLFLDAKEPGGCDAHFSGRR
jgi:hypothetical protein